MRRLLIEFIDAVRERPFSFKTEYIAECPPASEEGLEALRVLYDRTEYLMARSVIVDTVRRQALEVPSTTLRHMVATGTRYTLKSVLLLLRGRGSLRTLVQVAKHPLCQGDSMIRHLLIAAAHALEIPPSALDIYVNMEQEEFSDEERATWRLWQPLDALMEAINASRGMASDTLRLQLFENRPLCAEELARDLSDVFNIAPAEMRHVTRRRLVSLLDKYVDLTYTLCRGLAEGDLGDFQERLGEEDNSLPPGVLVPPQATDQVGRGGIDPTGTGHTTDRGEMGEAHGEIPGEESEEDAVLWAETDLTLDDLAFEPRWATVIPRMLAEELLLIPLHVEGDPPHQITVGCGQTDHSAAMAQLGHLDCEINFVDLPPALVRAAIRRFY